MVRLHGPLTAEIFFSEQFKYYFVSTKFDSIGFSSFPKIFSNSNFYLFFLFLLQLSSIILGILKDPEAEESLFGA